MAALNWYDADQKNFRNFLSWRDKKVGQLDLFKQKLIEYAEDITSLEVDAIEAALLNVLLILATGELVCSWCVITGLLSIGHCWNADYAAEREFFLLA